MKRKRKTVEREGKGEGFKPGSLLVSMGKIGKDRTKMKHSHRYPKLQMRIGDELLLKIEKEIDRSGMNTSEIVKQALTDYLHRRKEA